MRISMPRRFLWIQRPGDVCPNVSSALFWRPTHKELCSYLPSPLLWQWSNKSLRRVLSSRYMERHEHSTMCGWMSSRYFWVRPNFSLCYSLSIAVFWRHSRKQMCWKVCSRLLWFFFEKNVCGLNRMCTILWSQWHKKMRDDLPVRPVEKLKHVQMWCLRFIVQNMCGSFNIQLYFMQKWSFLLVNNHHVMSGLCRAMLDMSEWKHMSFLHGWKLLATNQSVFCLWHKMQHMRWKRDELHFMHSGPCTEQ